MTKRASFTQADIAKVLKGSAAAGESVARIEISPDGRIVAHFGKPGQTEGEPDDDEWTRRIDAQRQERLAGKRH